MLAFTEAELTATDLNEMALSSLQLGKLKIIERSAASFPTKVLPDNRRLSASSPGAVITLHNLIIIRNVAVRIPLDR